MVGFGLYLLQRGNGTPVAGPFSREDAARFARDVLDWAEEAETQEPPGD